MPALPAGFYPFWFWNDTLTRQEIRWQVAEMAAQGIRGFFIHPRQGLKDPPYLSAQFLERVGDAIQAAEENGLVVHLYDEYPYPSGIAGGLVTLGQPQFQATGLVQLVQEADGGPLRLPLPPGKLLCLLAFPLRDGEPDWSSPIDLDPSAGVVLEEDIYQETGLTRYNQKRFFSGHPQPVVQTVLPAGKWRLFASLQTVVDHHKYWGHFTDVLNPAAVRQFIQETHERYREHFAAKFGTTIRWIFTDEVAPGWSASLPEAYRAAYGRDLLPLLPALQAPAHPEHRSLSHELHELRYNLFCASFEEPVSAWCRANGLAYAAEKPALRFSQLRYQDIPGCEPGHVKAGAPLDLLQASIRGNARAVSSAAYFYGRDGALDECYHSLGWSATLEDVRWMADAQLLLGIRYLVPHGFFYSTHNLRKHDAPPSLFFQAPYWPLFHHLCERVEQVSRAFEGTWIDAAILILDPTASQPSEQDRMAYESLLQGLVGAHLDFHIGDTDILRSGQIEAGGVRLRDLEVRAVVIPPMQWQEPGLQAWLEEFSRAGGRVLRLAADFDLTAVLAALRQAAPPSLSLRSGGLENAALWSVCRRAPGSSTWFVLNTSPNAQTVELDCAQPLQELPLGRQVSPRLRSEAGSFTRRFAPFEACLFRSAPQGSKVHSLPAIEIPMDGSLPFRLLNPNLARLNTWRMSLLDEDGTEEQSAVVPAVPLANQLELGRFRIPAHFRRVFGAPPEPELPPLRVRYTHEFELATSAPVELIMEPGSIGGDWRLEVNGAALSATDFHLSAAHVRGSLGAEITALLRPGANTLQIELVSARPDGGLLSPLYLAGTFGVSLAPLRLVDLPASGSFEDYAGNRLPFFAGALEYRQAFRLAELPAAPRARLALRFPGEFHEACVVSLNGGDWRDLPWGPYELELETAELRRGSNAIVLRVYTTLIRSFEGQAFDYTSQRYISVEPAQPAD